MKALIHTQPYRMEYTDVPTPAAGKEEVLIRVKACGICGSDVHGYTGTTGRRIPPIVMGHEAAGVIVETGSQVKGWKIGDRVTFDSTISCGKCPFCRSGRINLCNNRRVLGVSCTEYKQNGAFAEYVAVPQHILYPLPEGLEFPKAAVTEPLSVALHAVNHTHLSENDTILVTGAGMIGNLVMQSLKHRGMKNIIVADTDPVRLKLAGETGATTMLDPGRQDIEKEIMQRTGGMGADAAFDAVGINPTFQTALNCLKKGGSLTLIGNYAPTVDFPLQLAVTREISLFGSYISSGEYPACLEMIHSGAVDTDRLISAVAPLSEGPSWFKRLHNKEPGLMKVVLLPED